jgi:hypothetical protein
MNAHVTTEELAAAIEKNLAGMADQGEVERMTRAYEHAVRQYDARRAAARREGKAEIDAIGAERDVLKATYEAELEQLATREETVRARTAERVAAADRLGAAARTALEALS